MRTKEGPGLKEAFKQLKKKSIIDSTKIEVIRRYIRSRFPEATPKQQSKVFADAVHRLIDGNIAQFEEEHRVLIKNNVFIKAAKKPAFAINADEIFTSALNIPDRSDAYFDSLTSWVATNQSMPVTREELVTLTEKLKDITPTELETKLEEVITILDEQERIERRIQEISMSMGLGATKKEPIKIPPVVTEQDQRIVEKPKQQKNLFVVGETPEETPWDLDSAVEAVMEPAKPMEELSIMGKRPIELPASETGDLESFSRKDADTFFDTLEESDMERKERLTPVNNWLTRLRDVLESKLKRVGPVKKATFQEVLIQLIILLILIVSIGTYFAFVGKNKVSIPVSEKLLKNGAIVDTYKDIFDMYLTKKSKSEK